MDDSILYIDPSRWSISQVILTRYGWYNFIVNPSFSSSKISFTATVLLACFVHKMDFNPLALSLILINASFLHSLNVQILPILSYDIMELIFCFSSTNTDLRNSN